MIAKELNIKSGSVMLYRKYSWIKKLWYEKILRKELPYNDFTLFNCNIDIVGTTRLNGIIAEPVKKYSNKEMSLLDTLLINSEDIDVKDLFTIINAVRPSTFGDKEDDLMKLLSSKYYKVRELSNETEYNEYIY